MSHDDVLFGFRLRLFSLASEIGVRPFGVSKPAFCLQIRLSRTAN
jgi:hypothetical protein